MTSVLTRRTARQQSSLRAPYRHDIDGLRALAILLVVVYHVWIGRVSGGVDVFLMVSAYLLTGSFARRIFADRDLRVGEFLLGRFRRLLPAAAVVLAATLGAAWLLLPQTQWSSLWREGWASLFYVQNWVLAFDGVDYYARDTVIPSPLQHFWSLSVQGQVFVLWPLLFLCAAWIIRRTRWSSRAVLIALFGVLFAASLVFSIAETRELQAFAYFDTRARLWEFAAGSLVALLVPLLRMDRRLRASLGWVGLVAIVVCGLVLDVEGGFPGYLALWPIIAAALVILAGSPDRSGSAAPVWWNPSRLLALPLLRGLGADAYALYLVHWPVLILWLSVRQQTRVSFLEGVVVVAISLVLARLVTILVEQPLRLPAGDAGRWTSNLSVIMASMLVVVAVIGPWKLVTTAPVAGISASSGTAVNLIPGPDAEDAERWARLDTPCAGAFASEIEVVQESCTQTDGAEGAARLLVIIGDSHSNQLAGALRPLTDERGWGIVMLMRPWCSLEAHEEESERAQYCDEWRTEATAHTLRIAPDSVFSILTAAAPDSPEERLLSDVETVIDEFTANGIRTFGVRDNPRSDQKDYYVCALLGEDCDFPVSQGLAAENPAARLADRVRLVDFTPWLCPDGMCRTTEGDIAIYLDTNHLSYPFARSLSAALYSQLSDYFDETPEAHVPF